MQIREIRLRNAHGLHARAAARIVKIAGRFSSRIVLVVGERRASARNIVAVMLLTAGGRHDGAPRDRRPGRAAALEAIAVLFALAAPSTSHAERPARWALRFEGARAEADGQLRAPRRRRLGRHRDRPRAARLARDARGRALHDPAVAASTRRSRASTTRSSEVQKELEGLHGAMTSGDVPGEFGAFLDVHWMILNDPTLVRGAEADHRRAALQRRVGADAADERAGRAVRPDRGSVPARAQGRRRAGRRARAEAPDGQARRAARGGRRGADDPRRARPVAGGRDPVQAAPLRRVPHRRRRRHVAHGDRRAQPQRAGGGRDAQRAAADPRQRDADRRRHATTSSSSIPTARCSPSTG